MYSQVEGESKSEGARERLATLRKSHRQGGASLLMANHIHIHIHGKQQQLSSTLKSVHSESAPSYGSIDARRFCSILIIKPAEVQ